MGRILADIGFLWQGVNEYDMARQSIDLALVYDPGNKEAAFRIAVLRPLCHIDIMHDVTAPIPCHGDAPPSKTSTPKRNAEGCFYSRYRLIDETALPEGGPPGLSASYKARDPPPGVWSVIKEETEAERDFRKFGRVRKLPHLEPPVDEEGVARAAARKAELKKKRDKERFSVLSAHERRKVRAKEKLKEMEKMRKRRMRAKGLDPAAPFSLY